MATSLTASKIWIAVIFFFVITGCKDVADVPFSTDETAYPEPVSKPFHFGAETKMKWTDSVVNVKPLIKKFDFDKLPDTAFDYNDLPSKTLRFETSILEPLN